MEGGRKPYLDHNGLQCNINRFPLLTEQQSQQTLGPGHVLRQGLLLYLYEGTSYSSMSVQTWQKGAEERAAGA